MNLRAPRKSAELRRSTAASAAKVQQMEVPNNASTPLSDLRLSETLMSLVPQQSVRLHSLKVATACNARGSGWDERGKRDWRRGSLSGASNVQCRCFDRHAAAPCLRLSHDRLSHRESLLFSSLRFPNQAGDTEAPCFKMRCA